MADKPLLSVVCVTYNHEKYIAQAIESFLMQKTTFPIEIVIGEDCSTDRTREICIEYQKKYPNKIRLLLREKNLGAMENHLTAIESCNSKFIANCEGDDYWTDPLKLQKQVDFLENNLSYTISCHHVLVLNENTGKFSDMWLRKWFKKKDGATIEDIIANGGGATCSLVWRNKVFGEFPNWYREQKGGDWSLQILCASKGKMKHFPDIMGVYRMHRGGAMSARISEASKSKVNIVEYHYENMQRLAEAMDNHFSGKYSKLFDISRRMNIWNAFSGYFFYGDYKNSKKFAFKLLPIFYYFPIKIIKKMVIKIFIIIILPQKVALAVLNFNKKRHGVLVNG